MIRLRLLVLGLALIPACRCGGGEGSAKPTPETTAAPDREAPPDPTTPRASAGRIAPPKRDPRAPSVPSMAPQGREEARARILAEFDADGDGRLGPEERARMQDDVRTKRLAGGDLNGDGVIDEKERQAIRLRHATKIVAGMDTDGDGRLSEAEVAAARDRGGARVDFATADADQDGSLDAEEVDQSLRKGPRARIAPAPRQ